MATSRSHIVALGLTLAVAAAALGLAFGPARPARPAGARPTLVPAPAPSGWRHMTLPDGAAVLFYPPGMHPVTGDRGSVSAAQVGPGGTFLLYLNATPRQGGESLRNWASYRVRLLRSDDASRASLDAADQGQPFRGGAGSCVIDHYVTRVHANHYTELACLVQGRTAASVIVAAAPTAMWPEVRAILGRAVAAYVVH